VEYTFVSFVALPPSQHSICYRTTVATIAFFHNEKSTFPGYEP